LSTAESGLLGQSNCRAWEAEGAQKERLDRDADRFGSARVPEGSVSGKNVDNELAAQFREGRN